MLKTKLNFKKLISTSLIALFFITANFELKAQEKQSDLKDFKIIVENIDNGIKLESLKGCAWVKLSFSLKNDKPQAVDEYGMTSLVEVASRKNSDPVDFLFTISKTKNEIVLKGIEGTAWTDLSFSLVENGKQAIDQFGMTTLD